MIKEKIKEDLKKYLKERKKEEVLTLREILNAISQKEKEKRKNLSDEEIFSLILKEIKKREEAIEAFEKGKREDLVKKEKKEVSLLKSYLPQMLSEKEIKKIAKETLKKLKISSPKEMGKAISFILEKYKGRVEGKKVAQIVKSFFQ